MSSILVGRIAWQTAAVFGITLYTVLWRNLTFYIRLSEQGEEFVAA